MKKNRISKFINPENIPDISKTGDVKTNDFDLNKEKRPALSTVKRQIKQTSQLINTVTNTTDKEIEFDRLKIIVNLIEDGSYISFKEWGLEYVSDSPERPPSFLESRNRRQEHTRHNNEHNNYFDISDLFDYENDNTLTPNDNSYIEHVKKEMLTDTSKIFKNADKNTINDEADIFTDKNIKKRIKYDDIKNALGLNNLYISKGFFVIDITGKFMADNGFLGSINRNNINNALQKVLDIEVVDFDIDKFLKMAQICLCDINVDIPLENKKQVQRYIDGICSFFPLVSNRFNIAKYGRHGLQLLPKSKSSAFSFVIYSKRDEISHNTIHKTKTIKYTEIIGKNGIELAERTLRLEVKLYSFRVIRKVLNIKNTEKGIVRLSDVLNANAPVVLEQIKLFSGNPSKLSEKLLWLQNTITTENMTLSEIFIAERFVEILKQNNFDIEIMRSHIRTEYANASDTELEYFNQLANIRGNMLNFLVYFKPKSITIMLDVIRRLQDYYNIDSETVK